MLNNEDRGLLFMCYQKDIATQFEFIQLKFANNPRFPAPDLDLNMDTILYRKAALKRAKQVL